MTSYKLKFKTSVSKDLRSIPKETVERIFLRLEALKADPFPHRTVKLSGTERLYRIRVGDYRIIYEVLNTELEIIVHFIRHRREAYRDI